MKTLLRRLVGLVVLLAIAGLVVYALLPRPVEVQTAAVERGPLRVTVDEEGRTRIRDRYVVSAPLAGRLQRIRLRVGDPVAAAETTLAHIAPTDPALLDARAQAEAQARVRAAEAAVERTEPLVAAELAEMQYAETQMARLQGLERSRAATREEVEQAELQYALRRQQYRSALVTRDIAQFELEQARAALLRTQAASDDLEPAGVGAETEANEYFELRSPITGRVLRVFQESETVVTPGERLLELGDPTDLEVEIDVLSSDAVRVAPGDRVLFEHWGGEAPLVGVVRTVEPSAFTKISALGVEEQRVNVIADLLSPPAQRATLGDGYRVEARIVVWEDDDVLKVPASALFRHGADWAVFVVDDGHARLQRVEIGRHGGLEAQVLAGLDEHQPVIAHPGDRVADGVAVESRPLAVAAGRR